MRSPYRSSSKSIRCVSTVSARSAERRPHARRSSPRDGAAPARPTRSRTRRAAGTHLVLDARGWRSGSRSVRPRPSPRTTSPRDRERRGRACAPRGSTSPASTAARIAEEEIALPSTEHRRARRHREAARGADAPRAARGRPRGRGRSGSSRRRGRREGAAAAAGTRRRTPRPSSAASVARRSRRISRSVEPGVASGASSFCRRVCSSRGRALGRDDRERVRVEA